MALRAQDRLLEQLDAARRRVGEIASVRLENLLRALGRHNFHDAQSLARFHDGLVFLRAFPPNPALLRRVESLLASFSQRIARLQAQDADLSILDEEELAGIAGTTLSALWNYDEVAWLARRFARVVAIDWDEYDKTERMAAALPRFIPLLEEDAWVEADVPYRRWLQAASGGCELAWLIRQFERLPVSPEERAEIFGALELPVRWQLGNSRATRTLGKRPVRQIFYHRGPLIQRREVSLAQELAAPPLRIKKLSRREGGKIIDLCREATTVRYRELYGTSRGDPAQVVHANVGRGVEIFLWGLPAERRLSLRAYQAGFTLKNGVPINYIEGIALFEWMEIGFNTFYAYRDGETAWVYAQALRMLHQVLGVTCISVYPYQLGQGNEEAIKSGAFWFYRKLGFRPMRPELARLAATEEKKITANPAYRTPAATLRRLAQGHVVYEMPSSQIGAWDRFQMRNVGLAVQPRMAEKFAGDSSRIRRAAKDRVAQLLGLDVERCTVREQRAFEDYALVLSLIPGLARWESAEKRQVEEIIRAKANSSEPVYSRLLQRHSQLRSAVLAIGSARATSEGLAPGSRGSLP
jgi:hypothetical protein